MSKPKKRPRSPYYYIDEVVDGLRIYRSTKCKTFREAERARRRIIDEAIAEHAAKVAEEEEREARRGTITFSQVAGRYQKSKTGSLSPRWAQCVNLYISRIQDHVGPDADFCAIGISDVADFVEEWIDAELSPKTMNNMLGVWSGLHNTAADEWELPVKRIAWQKVKFAAARERVRWIGRETLRQLMAQVPTPTAEIILWSVLTGCRKNETLTLTWHRVDTDAGVAEVKTKGGGTRFVDLSPSALSLLRRVRERRPKALGTVFDGTNLRKRFTAAVRAIELDDFRFHDLRHTFAVYLVADGVPIQTIQRALGHTQIATTQRYAHVRREDVQRAVASMSSTEGLTEVTHSITHSAGVTDDAPGVRRSNP